MSAVSRILDNLEGYAESRAYVVARRNSGKQGDTVSDLTLLAMEDSMLRLALVKAGASQLAKVACANYQTVVSQIGPHEAARAE